MEIIDFFIHFSSIIADNTSVICFTGEQSHPLFLDKLRKFVEKGSGRVIQKISSDCTVADIEMQLSTTFLGQSNWYWLGSLESIAVSKKKTDFIQFIKNYHGPHRLFVCMTQEELGGSLEHGVEYHIANSYTSDQIKKITLLYEDQKTEIIAYLFTKLFALKKEYSLDQLCLLKEYALLLGKNIDQFLDSWIEQLVVSDVSLFYLGQLFFEKNASEFFAQWQKVRPLYVDQFWTAFFSEQLFKAYFYVQYKGIVPPDQKQLVFGLPFSFLKHDWKMYQTSELQVAHQKIYEIDLSLKRGGSAYQLDSFCMLFFKGVFA